MTGKIILSFILSGLYFFATAQTTDPYAESGLGINASYGYVWPHREEVYNLRSHVSAVEFSYFKRTSGASLWERNLGRPTWGVSLLYMDYGKPGILGAGYGLLPWIEFPLVKGARGELNFKVTSGLGYLTRPWDLNSNPFNRTVGSHLNGNMGVHLYYNRRVVKNLLLTLGFGLNHYSNGNIRMPNLGINTPILTVGVRYITTRVKGTENYKQWMAKGDLALQAGVIVGFKESDYVYRHFVTVPNIQVKLMHSLSAKNRITAGIDVAKDKADYFYTHLTEENPKVALKEQLELGIKAGHELLVSRLAIVTEMGVYLVKPNAVKGSLFHRVGFTYDVTPRWVANVTLKTHFSRADYFEWGIFYKLKLRRRIVDI